jgi:hypothetical protein
MLRGLIWILGDSRGGLVCAGLSDKRVKKRDGGDKPTVAFWPRERVNFDDVRVSLFAFPFSFPPPLLVLSRRQGLAVSYAAPAGERESCKSCKSCRSCRSCRSVAVVGTAAVTALRSRSRQRPQSSSINHKPRRRRTSRFLLRHDEAFRCGHHAPHQEARAGTGVCETVEDLVSRLGLSACVLGLVRLVRSVGR